MSRSALIGRSPTLPEHVSESDTGGEFPERADSGLASLTMRDDVGLKSLAPRPFSRSRDFSAATS